jgi:TPR repeat protein
MRSWRVCLFLILIGCHHGSEPASKAGERIDVTSQLAGCAGLVDCEGKCSAGLANACVEAGRLHEFGHAGARDPGRAYLFYDRACQLGFSGGCFNLAVLLESGKAVAKDTRRAAELYAQVCRAGAKTACARAEALTEH